MSQPVPEVPISIAGRIGVLRPLRLRDFRFLWTGMTVSMVGDGIYIVAIAWQVIDLSKSPSALALVGIAWSLPQVMFVLASGVLADRFDRRRLMISGDLIRFGAIGAIGVLSVTDRLTLPAVVALVVVYGTGQAVFQPAFNAIVPTLVPSDLLVEANSLGQFVKPFATTLVGPLVGSLLIAIAGPGWAFLMDGASFAFSAAMVFAIRARPAARDDKSERAAWRELADGFRYVRDSRWLLVAMIGGAISLLFTWGPWEALVPFVVRRQLGGGPLALGFVFGAGGLGSVVAALMMGQRGRLPRRPVTTLYVAWALGLLGTAAFGLVTQIWQAMLAALATEAAITVLLVIWYTLIQRLVPGHLLGRVASLDWALTTAGVPLSFAIVGPSAAAIGVDATLIAAGVLGGVITLAVMLVPGAREPERDGSIDRIREADRPARRRIPDQRADGG